MIKCLFKTNIELKSSSVSRNRYYRQIIKMSMKRKSRSAGNAEGTRDNIIFILFYKALHERD